jgi:hypothetical protein
MQVKVKAKESVRKMRVTACELEVMGFEEWALKIQSLWEVLCNPKQGRSVAWGERREEKAGADDRRGCCAAGVPLSATRRSPSKYGYSSSRWEGGRGWKDGSA